MQRSLALLLAGLLGVVASPLRASIIYTTGSSRQFGYIDTTTLRYTEVTADLGGPVYSLTWNPDAQVFFGQRFVSASENHLVTVTRPGSLSIEAALNGRMYGLAYDPIAAALYGYNYEVDDLVTINPTSGAQSAIGDSGVVAWPAFGGRLSPLDGSIFMTASLNTGSGQFGSLDKNTGDFTTLATGTIFQTMMLASCDGVLFGVNRSSSDRSLYTVNPVNGSWIRLGAVTGENLPIAFIGAAGVHAPEPGAWAMMGVTMLLGRGFMLWRRRSHSSAA